jgi:hypothetical protein
MDIIMARPFTERPVALKTDELLRVDDGEDLEVMCLDGAVWITQADDPRDIVISAGESFVLDRPGAALICAAAGPAVVAVEVSLSLPPSERSDGRVASSARPSA